MSYDVDVADESFNYTYNLARFFIDFDVHPPTRLRGLTGAQAADRIYDALRLITSWPVARLEEYNAPNGWGDWAGATVWLMQIRDAAKANPDAIVEVS